MGGKTTKNYERQLSQQELQLLETQNQMMQQGIDIAQTAENRSESQYQDWQDTYRPVETGMIPRGATRETGYRRPQPQMGNRMGGKGQGGQAQNPQAQQPQGRPQTQQPSQLFDPNQGMAGSLGTRRK